MDAVERFAALVSMPEGQIDLARAALAIAAGAYHALDEGPWLRELDDLAVGVGDLEGLRRRLFQEIGFRGNTSSYYEPDNSFLHRVLERRVGIPISLSVVIMEVTRRSGIELEGVGMPGHFLVRDPGSGAYLDPFGGGRLLDEHGCEEMFRAATGAGPEVTFGAWLVPTVGKRQILARMLANLKGIYRTLSSAGDLEWVLRMRLALPEVPVLEVVELGESLAMRGQFANGAAEIEARVPGASEELSERLGAAARALRARLN